MPTDEVPETRSRRWRYQLAEDFYFDLSKNASKYGNAYASLKKVADSIDRDLEFRDKEEKKVRLIIQHGGIIHIPVRYAWDGCSPTVDLWDLIWLGIPDGVIDIETGYPMTYYASLVHDALGQFRLEPDMPFDRWQRDLIFLLLLNDFKLRYIYFAFVVAYGFTVGSSKDFFARTFRSQ